MVVFDKLDFDNNVIIEDSFLRYGGTKNQKKGLISKKNIKKHKKLNKFGIDENQIFHLTDFHKLKLGNKNFFSKKHKNEKDNEIEKNNIIKIYDNIPIEKLLKFYGYSEKFGFIYDFIDDFQYKGKSGIKIDNLSLKDVDIILVNGVEKYIDFYL